MIKRLPFILNTILAYFLLILPLSFIHETGHGYVCNAEGYPSFMNFTYRGAELTCVGNAEFDILYNVAGPLFGIAGAEVFVIIAWQKFRKYPGMAIAGLAMVVDQVMKLVIEGFYQNVYKSTGQVDLAITAIQLSSLLLLMMIFIIIHDQRSIKKLSIQRVKPN